MASLFHVCVCVCDSLYVCAYVIAPCPNLRLRSWSTMSCKLTCNAIIVNNLAIILYSYHNSIEHNDNIVLCSCMCCTCDMQLTYMPSGYIMIDKRFHPCIIPTLCMTQIAIIKLRYRSSRIQLLYKLHVKANYYGKMFSSQFLFV